MVEGGFSVRWLVILVLIVLHLVYDDWLACGACVPWLK